MATTQPSHSVLRIFGFSALISLVILAGVLLRLGPQALLTAIILVIVELTFSFDNAIVNAKILQHMSAFWQRMFMTIGILIAVFGMRVLFPVVLVQLTAGLGFGTVIDLAIHHPAEYATILVRAHPLIASFGGMFLMMLGLTFFFSNTDTFWLTRIEKWLARIGQPWLATVVSTALLVALTLLPLNHHPKQTLIAGSIGIVSFLIVHSLSLLFPQPASDTGGQLQKVGMAGFVSFIYLEVLDASFSLDGVVGAFAITQNVILIAIGLGIGALWVRSLTLFIVKRGTLSTYPFLDHGAHYTIVMLAVVLLTGLFFEVPEYIPGAAGLLIIGSAVYGSVRAARR